MNSSIEIAFNSQLVNHGNKFHLRTLVTTLFFKESTINIPVYPGTICSVYLLSPVADGSLLERMGLGLEGPTGGSGCT